MANVCENEIKYGFVRNVLFIRSFMSEKLRFSQILLSIISKEEIFQEIKQVRNIFVEEMLKLLLVAVKTNSNASGFIKRFL